MHLQMQGVPRIQVYVLNVLVAWIGSSEGLDFLLFIFIFILSGCLYLSSGNYTMRGLAKLQLVQHKLASIASETLLLIHPEGQMVEPCYLFILLKA